jgi:hypothetical protein
MDVYIIKMCLDTFILEKSNMGRREYYFFKTKYNAAPRVYVRQLVKLCTPNTSK